MMGIAILQPVVALAAWTMVMWAWMYATRIPAMLRGKIDGNRTADDPEATFDRLLPPHVQWKAHNYNHLHEAPTVFYAVALVLALVREGDGINAWLGWAYVALRVLHSIIQATINRVAMRFALFVLSSLVLMALIVHAAIAISR